VPWAWAGVDQARAPTTTANSMTSAWRGRRRADRERPVNGLVVCMWGELLPETRL
jgi:hypothetical protein